MGHEAGHGLAVPDGPPSLVVQPQGTEAGHLLNTGSGVHRQRRQNRDCQGTTRPRCRLEHPGTVWGNAAHGGGLFRGPPSHRALLATVEKLRFPYPSAEFRLLEAQPRF